MSRLELSPAQRVGATTAATKSWFVVTLALALDGVNYPARPATAPLSYRLLHAVEEHDDVGKDTIEQDSEDQYENEQIRDHEEDKMEEPDERKTKEAEEDTTKKDKAKIPRVRRKERERKESMMWGRG